MCTHICEAFFVEFGHFAESSFLTFHNNSLVVHFNFFLSFTRSYGSAEFFISAPCFIFVIVPNTGLKIYINMHEKEI